MEASLGQVNADTLLAYYYTREKQGALQASESAIRVAIYHMLCQLSSSLLISLEYIAKTFVHVHQKDFLSNIL